MLTHTKRHRAKIADILEVNISEILEIEQANQFNQTTRDQSTGYLQKIENFYQKNKEQYQKIIELYEMQLKDKDDLINQLRK